MTKSTSERAADLDAKLRQDALRKRLPQPPMRRAIRQGRGLSNTAVGDYCGVTRQVAAMWERGIRNPSGERLERYVELLTRLSRDAS